MAEFGKSTEIERAKSYMAFGKGLFQALYVSLFILPITAIFQAQVSGNPVSVSPLTILDEMSASNFAWLLGLWGVGVVAGISSWTHGLKRLDKAYATE